MFCLFHLLILYVVLHYDLHLNDPVYVLDNKLGKHNPVSQNKSVRMNQVRKRGDQEV